MITVGGVDATDKHPALLVCVVYEVVLLGDANTVDRVSAAVNGIVNAAFLYKPVNGVHTGLYCDVIFTLSTTHP